MAKGKAKMQIERGLKNTVFVPLPQPEPVKEASQDAPVGEVFMMYLPVRCMVKYNPAYGKEEGQMPKMIEVDPELPMHYQFNMQNRLVLGYMIPKSELAGKDEIDILEEVAKMKAADKAHMDMLVASNVAAVTGENILETLKTNSDGKVKRMRKA